MLAPLAVLGAGLLFLVAGLGPRMLGHRVDDEHLLLAIGSIAGGVGLVWLVCFIATGR